MMLSPTRLALAPRNTAEAAGGPALHSARSYAAAHSLEGSAWLITHTRDVEGPAPGRTASMSPAFCWSMLVKPLAA